MTVCGIFAYVGTTPPDPDLMRAAGAAAARRGPHAHGWIADGHPHHQLGPLDLDRLAAVTAETIVGHTRLATSGHHNDPHGIQPVTVDGHHVAFNGSLDPNRVDDDAGPTDTHTLAVDYARLRRDRIEPALTLPRLFDGHRLDAAAVVVVDADNGAVWAMRRRLPLYRHVTVSGVYLASRPFTDAVARLPDHPSCLQGDP